MQFVALFPECEVRFYADPALCFYRSMVTVDSSYSA